MEEEKKKDGREKEQTNPKGEIRGVIKTTIMWRERPQFKWVLEGETPRKTLQKP